MTTPLESDNPFLVLERHGVRFVIVGGYAVNFHGFIRATEAFDVVWDRSPAADRRLLNALLELDARYIGSDVDPCTGIERMHPVTATYLATRHLLMLWTRYGYLDLFDYVPGHPSTDVGELFTTAVVHGGLPYVARHWLVAMKRASGRFKDLEDLRGLGESAGG